MKIRPLNMKSITKRTPRLVSLARNNLVICVILLMFLLFIYIQMAPAGFLQTGIGEVLRELDEVDVKKDRIFFVETADCTDIDPRQACSVESAARANSNSQVYFLTTSQRASLRSHFIGLLHEAYPDVAFRHINPLTHSKGTVMEDWFREVQKHLNSSRYPVNNLSNSIRLLLLLKHGGTYLDLDVVVMKSLEGLRNVAGAESNQLIGNSVLSFDGPEGIGHELVEKMAQEFVTTFKGNIWAHNGPGVVTRVLDKLCRKPDKGGSVAWSECPYGFRVLPPSAFYPIHWSKWQRYFNNSNVGDTMRIIEEGMVAHIWNRLSSKTKVSPGSRQPYGLLAEKHCPVVYRNTGGYM